MSVCQRRFWIDSPTARRFSNLLELLTAFASNSTDRKERRGKRTLKRMFEGPLCVRCGPLFDYKLAQVSFQKLFLSISPLIRISRKNWPIIPLQKSGSLTGAWAGSNGG